RCVKQLAGKKKSQCKLAYSFEFHNNNPLKFYKCILHFIEMNRAFLAKKCSGIDHNRFFIVDP
ncbi:hypothetical protein WAI05_22740, partial [Acinetobacter baumannii]